MKPQGFAFIPAIIIVAAFAVGASAYFITGQKDSPMEEAAEAVLKTEGIDVEFSPKCDPVVEACHG